MNRRLHLRSGGPAANQRLQSRLQSVPARVGLDTPSSSGKRSNEPWRGQGRLRSERSRRQGLRKHRQRVRRRTRRSRDGVIRSAMVGRERPCEHQGSSCAVWWRRWHGPPTLALTTSSRIPSRRRRATSPRSVRSGTACSFREREGCMNDAWNIVPRFVDPFPASSSDELDDDRRRPNEVPDTSSRNLVRAPRDRRRRRYRPFVT